MIPGCLADHQGAIGIALATLVLEALIGALARRGKAPAGSLVGLCFFLLVVLSLGLYRALKPDKPSKERPND